MVRYNGIFGIRQMLDSLDEYDLYRVQQSYLCEAVFLTVAMIKSKYRKKIHVKHKVMVTVSCFIPRFDKMFCEQQAHPSQLITSMI